MKRLPAVLALALATTGCELDETVTAVPESLVIVEGYLRAGAEQQWIFLHRSRGRGDSLAVDTRRVTVRGENGAELRYFRAGIQACVDSAGAPETLGTCYTASGLGPGGIQPLVRPGIRYTLDIELTDGRLIGATTTVPGAYELIGPAGSGSCALPPGTTVELRWRASTGAWAYVSELQLSGLREVLDTTAVEVPEGNLILQGLSISATDTTIVVPNEFGIFERFGDDADLLRVLQGGLPEGLRAPVVVAAVDRNYVNWARGGNFNPSGLVRVPSVRGERATGVFGSLVPRRVVVDVTQEEGLPRCGDG